MSEALGFGLWVEGVRVGVWAQDSESVGLV